MDKLKVYLALIGLYAMVIWIAWEYSRDALRAARERRNRRGSGCNHESSEADES
jgi:hypothetical protein